jgi:hypothetical protein
VRNLQLTQDLNAMLAWLMLTAACHTISAVPPDAFNATHVTAGETMSAQMHGDRHTRLSPLRRGTAADSARARQFVVEMRRVLAKYQDMRVARADGFRQFLRNLKQPVYHFTNWRWAIEAMVRFDPARPTSLLYEQWAEGRFRLVGAMYTAPASASDDDLDARIPLSVARWHAHVDWCVPPPGAFNRWHEHRAGLPVFGPQSPIATRAGCDSVGGRFRPRMFDWSVHVYAFAGDDPTKIWSVDHLPGGTGGP